MGLMVSLSNHAAHARAMACSLALLCSLAIAAPAQAQNPVEDLSIVTATGTHAFKVEMAVSPEARVTGLMHRKSVAPDGGMLFIYDTVGREAMWMKNTLVPLDMLFIDQHGVIAHIVERTVPLSLETISSRHPVKATLELRGGSAERLGIKVGDKVRHKAFE